MIDADRHYHPLQQPEPGVMQSEVYAPYEVESGYKRHVPDKRIFEEEMHKEYVVPFEYEKTGGSYRYGCGCVSGQPSVKRNYMAGVVLSSRKRCMLGMHGQKRNLLERVLGVRFKVAHRLWLNGILENMQKVFTTHGLVCETLVMIWKMV